MIRVAPVLAVVAAGCPGTAVPLANHGDAVLPEVELVVAGARTVRFARTTPAGLVVTRAVELPARNAQLEWAGADPVVRLHGNPYTDDPARDDEIGQITATGYVPLATPPAATWNLPRPEDRHRLVTPLIEVAVDDRGATWRARCEWTLTGNAEHCDTWAYARLDPPPLAVVTTTPVLTKRPLPPVAPPAGYAVTLSGEAPQRMRCTSPTTSVEYPPEAERGGGDFLGMSDVTWLSNDPPIFEAHREIDGIVPHGEWIVFEGCEPSKRFPDAEVVVGPRGLVAIAAFDDMVVIWHGRVIGTLDKIDRVRFAPR